MRQRGLKNYLLRKQPLGIILGMLLAIIVLKVDKKLWLPLELETLNTRNISWLNNKKITNEDIVVILFDDKTQFLLRQNSLPIKDFEKRGRDLIKSAVEKLESNKVRAIGINLNLSSPSGTPSDEKLAKTISSFRNIVIADTIYSTAAASNIILMSASSLGFGELFADYDKIVHKTKLVEKGYNGSPSFAYALFKTFIKNNIDRDLRTKNEFYLRYPNKPFTKYSFIELLQGRISPSLLKDKVVILGIGLRSKLLRDQLVSPYDRTSYISDSEVQAAALTNLINKCYLFKLSLSDYLPIFMLLSMFLGMIFSSTQSSRRLTIFVVLFINLIIFSQLAYGYSKVVLEVVPIFFLLLGNLVIGSLIFLQLNLHRKNLDLEAALEMLRKGTTELEASEMQLQNKNIQLNNTLSELNKRVSELKEVRKQLSTKSEEERKRIARELHDDSLARITDLKRYIESILNSSSFSASIKKELCVSIQTLDSVTHEIRRVINALRPSMLDNALGFIPAIENLLDELTKRSNHKIQTKLATTISKLKFSEVCEINLYRIIQEALNNVFKHSNASKVEIIIEKQPGQILLLIKDNGIGFANINNKKGFGLIDMKERAELIGAMIQYLNKPHDTGTTLEITIPLEKIEQVEESNKQWCTLTSVT